MTHFKSIDPATGETVWEGAAASVAEVRAATDRARAAFPDWADRLRQDRIEAVKRYPAVLQGVFGRIGLNPADFRAYRGKVDSPPVASAVMIERAMLRD